MRGDCTLLHLPLGHPSDWIPCKDWPRGHGPYWKARFRRDLPALVIPVISDVVAATLHASILSG